MSSPLYALADALYMHLDARGELVRGSMSFVVKGAPIKVSMKITRGSYQERGERKQVVALIKVRGDLLLLAYFTGNRHAFLVVDGGKISSAKAARFGRLPAIEVSGQTLLRYVAPAVVKAFQRLSHGAPEWQEWKEWKEGLCFDDPNMDQCGDQFGTTDDPSDFGVSEAYWT